MPHNALFRLGGMLIVPIAWGSKDISTWITRDGKVARRVDTDSQVALHAFLEALDVSVEEDQPGGVDGPAQRRQT